MPDAESNPNPNLYPSTAKQHAVESIQLNIVSCPTYAEKIHTRHRFKTLRCHCRSPVKNTVWTVSQGFNWF